MSESEKPRTIIIAMDKSENSDRAFSWFWDNIRRESDRVVLLHVPDTHSTVQSPLEISDLSHLKDLFTEEDRTAAQVLDKLEDKLKRRHSAGKVCAIQGRPGEVIVQYAKEEKADLIVTGSRNMGTVQRTLMGSVSDYVTHHANIPVLVYKH